MKKRNKSILQKDMTRCWICKTTINLEIHEVFFGTANRKKSIDHDCYVALCPHCHRVSNNSVHLNKETDLKLKQEMQRKFEELHSHDEFMQIFKRNYL